MCRCLLYSTKAGLSQIASLASPPKVICRETARHRSACQEHVHTLTYFHTYTHRQTDIHTYTHTLLQTAECLEVPHLAHGIVSVVACGVFTLLAFVVTLIDFEPNPSSRRWMATPHSSVEVLNLRRVGQNHIYIYGVHTVFLAGK